MPPVKPNDVVVLIGAGPLGTGMEETYQLTSALKYLPWGKTVAIVTDARFSGVSTGACIGHVGPEALAGGPIGKLVRRRHRRDRDRSRDSSRAASISSRWTGGRSMPRPRARLLASRDRCTRSWRPHARLPDDTRLWAALQQASGGTWGGCVYDVDAIVAVINAGVKALAEENRS